MAMFRAAGVIGWPARHSRSPLIHGHWLERHDLSGAYLRLEIPPERFEATLKDVSALGLVGANVTVPHKEAALAAADGADEIATRLGAANTLWLDGGRLFATNTDLHGFLANLDERAPRWEGQRRVALVLGAGGAARAVVAGCLTRGFTRVVLANRTLARAEALAYALGPKVVPVPLAEAGRHLHAADLVANTTSIGVTGADTLALDWARAPESCIATDIVYVPLITPFLAAAAGRGLRIVDGLGMLLHQAAPGFERWFGVRPSVTPELRALIEADLMGSRS